MNFRRLFKRHRMVITPQFVERVRAEGALAKAAERLASSTKTFEPLMMSTWALVCEEVLDTEFPPEHYERVVAELYRRGISRTELDEMRAFAWETAGWLNFEKMLWDWCGLDADDISRSIDWQFREGEIDATERARRRGYLKRFSFREHLEKSNPNRPV